MDCELLSKVYVNLLGQKEPSLKFVESQNIQENFLSKSKKKYSKKIILPSDLEKEQHSIFLKKKLKKNYFN